MLFVWRSVDAACDLYLPRLLSPSPRPAKWMSTNKTSVRCGLYWKRSRVTYRSMSIDNDARFLVFCVSLFRM